MLYDICIHYVVRNARERILEIKYFTNNMNLKDEYIMQNQWRNWEQYFVKVPFDISQKVLDIGCSVGFVSDLLSKYVNMVCGIENNEVLLEVARSRNNPKCQFVKIDIEEILFENFTPFDGVWMSFVIAYLRDPLSFLKNIKDCISKNGWIVIIDINGFISGNMDPSSKYYKKVIEFESVINRNYNFKIGSRIKEYLEKSGFKIIEKSSQIVDFELCFKGSASKEVIENWQARFNRMVTLKSFLDNEYDDFVKEFIRNISSPVHVSKNCINYCVGISE